MENAVEINTIAVKISFKDVTYKIKDTTILAGISGYALPGHTHYIMGASGAGKTTLLNVLSDRIPKSAKVLGDIQVNDTISLLQEKVFGQFGAYVMQDDTLHEFFTVRECLTFAARLKLGRMTKEQ